MMLQLLDAIDKRFLADSDGGDGGQVFVDVWEWLERTEYKAA